jgi:hypothetical protein
MSLVKAVMTNIFSLVCAALVGFVAVDIAVYILRMPVGAIRIGPLFSGTFLTIIVAVVAPRSNFKVRFYAFAAIHLLDLALWINATVISAVLVNRYLGGAPPAKPWAYAGLLVHVIAGAVGYFMIRRSVSSQPVGM